jgi:hypothetical protein
MENPRLVVDPPPYRRSHDALDGIIADRVAAAKRASAGRELVEREFVIDDNVRTLAQMLKRHVPPA